MNANEIFNALFNGGKVSQHWLIEFTQGNRKVRVVNNNESINYGGFVYSATSFNYSHPNNKGEGGSLEITCFDNDIVEFIDNADDKYSMRVVGVLAEDRETITPVNVYKHFYGSVTVGTDGNINFQLGKDDRLDMKFTVQKYDTLLNPGNA